MHYLFPDKTAGHALFLEAGFTPANALFSEKAEYFKCEFEKLLCEAVRLGGGIVG